MNTKTNSHVQNKLMVARSEGGGETGKKGNSEVQTASYKISHSDIKYSVGTRVSNTVVLMSGAGRALHLSR